MAVIFQKLAATWYFAVLLGLFSMVFIFKRITTYLLERCKKAKDEEADKRQVEDEVIDDEEEDYNLKLTQVAL